MTKYFILNILMVFTAAADSSVHLHYTVRNGTGYAGNELLTPYIKLGGNYYLFETEIWLPWMGAVNYCRTKGALLTSIESGAEYQLFNSYLISRSSTASFWIAANDIDEPFKFFWMNTGKPVRYAKWSPGQPDNHEGVESCVHLRRHRFHGDYYPYDMNDYQS